MKNPIFKGYFADPEIHFYEGRYSVYPTQDGQNWHGTDFRCYSSTDLENWKMIW